jgi:hypothetical protein
LAAVGTGDIRTPAARRVVPAATRGACAALPAPPGRGRDVLSRAPYLQRVTAHQVVVIWTSGEGSSASVLVQDPDGTHQRELPATIDTTAAAPPDDFAPWQHERSSKLPRQWMVVVSGLVPDTTYCYTVYQDGRPVTAPAPFVSAPRPGADRPFQFVALGDSGGGGSDQLALLAQIETVPFDFMIHTGDIAYDHGTLADFETRFFTVYARLLAIRPMFPTTGNHDYDTEDAAPFRRVFVLPENGGVGGVERWYSYDWGNAHFVVLDTERTGPIQAAWLDADLAANKLPWTIVYGHKPPHSSGRHRDDEPFNRFFVPVLNAHHVQLVLSGHDHHYERFHPFDGVTYIITGGGGRGVREIGPRRVGSAFAEAVIHFVLVTVESRILTVHAIDGTGREFDTTVIDRTDLPVKSAEN